MRKALSFYFIYLSVVGTISAQSYHKQIDSNAIGLWADSIITRTMTEMDIPGVTFAFVSGDSLVYSRGFGNADLINSSEMKVRTSNFDMGSIPKALTAVAVLQLVEQGKVQLDIPIGNYIELNNTELSNHVSLRNLLTHTAGLDDISNIASAAFTCEDVPTLEQYVMDNEPVPFSSPGKIISYSNLGYAIIGRVIEKVSGLSFPQYMNDMVLQPLHMTNSTFDCKLSKHISKNRVTGYEFDGSGLQPVRQNYQYNTPAAGLRSTAGDMANFLGMLLNDGKFNERVILGEKSLKMLFEQQFTNHPDIQGLTFSMREENIDGYRAFAQNGGWQGFNHDYYVFKDANFAFITCINTNEGSELSTRLAKSFVATFLPKKEVPTPEISDVLDLGKYTGIYRSNRYSRNSITKLGILLGAVAELEIGARNDSLFYFSTPLAYLGNNVFQRVDTGAKIAFLEDSDGNVTQMVRDYSHYDANTKIHPLESASALIGFYKLLFGLQILVLVIFLWTKVRYAENRFSKYDLTTQLIPTLLSLVFVVGFIWSFFSVGPWDLQYGMDKKMKLLLIIPIVLTGMLPILAYMVFVKWAKSQRRLSRWNSILSFVTLSLFLWYLSYWNLIGFNY